MEKKKNDNTLYLNLNNAKKDPIESVDFISTYYSSSLCKGINIINIRFLIMVRANT